MFQLKCLLVQLSGLGGKLPLHHLVELAAGEPVLWDYHVVAAVFLPSGAYVCDFDTRLDAVTDARLCVAVYKALCERAAPPTPSAGARSSGQWVDGP